MAGDSGSWKPFHLHLMGGVMEERGGGQCKRVPEDRRLLASDGLLYYSPP